jgi:transcriptional regulator with XRE-family HTH domain
MFFDRVKSLCEERNTSVTAVAGRIGISKSNVTNWKNGGLPSGEILLKLADELETTVDFLLERTEVKSIKSPLFTVSMKLTKTPQRIAVLNGDGSISDTTIKAITQYLGCSIAFLFGAENRYNPDGERVLDHEALTDIFQILDFCAENEEYEKTQVQISYIVALNLDAIGIKRKDLLDEKVGLSTSVVNNLWDKIKDPSKKVKNGFYISDLFKIKDRLSDRFAKNGVDNAVVYMLTGKK